AVRDADHQCRHQSSHGGHPLQQRGHSEVPDSARYVRQNRDGGVRAGEIFAVAHRESTPTPPARCAALPSWATWTRSLAMGGRSAGTTPPLDDVCVSMYAPGPAAVTQMSPGAAPKRWSIDP